jgi:hypothetical protein
MEYVCDCRVLDNILVRAVEVISQRSLLYKCHCISGRHRYHCVYVDNVYAVDAGCYGGGEDDVGQIRLMRSPFQSEIVSLHSTVFLHISQSPFQLPSLGSNQQIEPLDNIRFPLQHGHHRFTVRLDGAGPIGHRVQASNFTSS